MLYTAFIIISEYKNELLLRSECLRTREVVLRTIRIDLHSSAAVIQRLRKVRGSDKLEVRTAGTKRYGVKRDALRIQHVPSGAKMYPDYSGPSRVFRHGITPPSCQIHALTPAVRSFLLNPLNAELNPMCHLLALLGAHHIFHISRIRIKVQKSPVCL